MTVAPSVRVFAKHAAQYITKSLGYLLEPFDPCSAQVEGHAPVELLNAGYHVTSIQRFLGHKDLASTMIYARAHDQTVAEDYFAAIQRVEQRLQIGEEKKDEVVKVREQAQVFQLIQQLETPELCFEERLVIANQLREVLGRLDEYLPLNLEDHMPAI